jgi:hypothetical protein
MWCPGMLECLFAYASTPGNPPHFALIGEMHPYAGAVL